MPSYALGISSTTLSQAPTSGRGLQGHSRGTLGPHPPVFLVPGNHDPLTSESVWAAGHAFRARRSRRPGRGRPLARSGRSGPRLPAPALRGASRGAASAGGGNRTFTVLKSALPLRVGSSLHALAPSKMTCKTFQHSKWHAENAAESAGFTFQRQKRDAACYVSFSYKRIN